MGGIVQTNYNQYMDEAYAGQISKASLGNNISMVQKVSPVGFGLAVVQGTEDGECISPTATGAVFRGVTVRNLNINNNEANIGEYQVDEFVAIRNFGSIMVIAESNVAKDGDVYFRHTAGTGSVLGSFLATADTATADRIVGARFNGTALAGELVEIILPSIY